MDTVENVLLAGVVGSTAYGLAHEGSDVDVLGVFAAPTTAFHGLHRPKESHVTVKPDATYHEAAKWCRLALACNPTAMELVWLDDYTVIQPLGSDLRAIRTAFLSARGVRNAYLGYATQQFRKLGSRGDGTFSSDTRRRSAKHARHLLRLLEQGKALHRTGRLPIRVEYPAALRVEADSIVVDPDLGRGHLRVAEEVFDGPGVLPDVPDAAAVEAWLLRVRRDVWLESEPTVRLTLRGRRRSWSDAFA